MYRSLLVPVDGSASSARAGRVAVALARGLDARVRAIHVDAAGVLATRRARLADTLPPDRRVTDIPTPVAPVAVTSSVATHLAVLEAEARDAKVPFEQGTVAGAPVEVLLDEIARGGHDLVVLGAVGQRARENRPLGSTCERLVRHARTDLLVVREAVEGSAEANAGDASILACIDGSPQSFGALEAALALAPHLSARVEAVAVYDPYLHYTLFNGIVGVLSEKASKIFKFKDQEKLHEEIIDTGLAKIYQAHLEVARGVAAERGTDLRITLLDGKAPQKILKHVARRPPSLVVMGRIGVHSTDTMDVGATTENVLRQLRCDVLVSSRTFVPPIDLRAAESVQWVPEALAKMERVPSFVRGVARTAIIRWAVERGHSIITPGVINSCMGDILPRSAAQAMGYVAEETAKAKGDLIEGRTFVCSECGHASKEYRPVTCPVCKAGSERFEAIDRDVLASVGPLERGAVETEETFDGRALTWTAEAKDVLRRVPNGYERRRAKARIEKTAKVRGLAAIDGAFALDMVQQDMAETSYLSARGERMQVEVAKAEQPDDTVTVPREESPLPWTDAAWKRICRVPQGFMRDMTREKVEQFAAQAGRADVDLALCEAGIAEGRRMMAEMIGQYGSGGAVQQAVRAAAGGSTGAEVPEGPAPAP